MYLEQCLTQSEHSRDYLFSEVIMLTVVDNVNLVVLSVSFIYQGFVNFLMNVN